MEPISIIVADDSATWRKRLVADLGIYNIQCKGQAANGAELLEQLAAGLPDVLLLDLQMPVMDGNDTMRGVMELYPGLPIIIMSVHNSEELINDYVARGARGYLPKDSITIESLADAIRRVKSSPAFICRPPVNRSQFTPRQAEIIPLLCEGLTNKEISERVGITEWGVEKQRRKIYEKTGSKRAVDFYKYAFRQGLDFLHKLGRRR